jgi:hypothetical protein
MKRSPCFYKNKWRLKKMTPKNERSETLKKAQASPIGGENEAGKGKITDLELGEMEKHYGVKETLNYVLGLDMENDGNTEYAGELTRDQTNGLKKDTEHKPH